MDVNAFRSWFSEVTRLVVDNADHLTHLDAAIGDADHGINLRRGFEAARVMLEQANPSTPAEVLATVGRALISKTGGASGPLYGTGFRQAAKALDGQIEVSAVQLGAALQAHLAGIQHLGAAAEGDKTMVDALAPAVRAYHGAVAAGADIAEATRAAASAAARGLHDTVSMQARKGRASYLGPRTVGHEDPGAASTALIMQALATANEQQSADGQAPAYRWTGMGVSPGTVVAASRRIDRPIALSTRPLDSAEVQRALQAVVADLESVASLARAQGRSAAADIVAVGALIAADPELVDAVSRAAALDEPLQGILDAVETYAAQLESLPDETLRERAADVRQVGRRLVVRLTTRGARTAATPVARRFVVVAEELGPADLLEYVGAGLVGAVAVRGGANSHAAIIARSVGLPLVVGVSHEILDLADAAFMIVDAEAGTVVANPTNDEIARASAASARDRQRRAVLAADRSQSHHTVDGQGFTLQCNVASDTEVRAGRDRGADGIGLLRTELPFMDADRWPTEADHRRALRLIFTEAAGWPLTVRLLDFANDKVPPFLRGERVGLAALLDNPNALTAQVRALVDLGRDTPMQIMVPMVSSAAELRAVRAVIDRVVVEMNASPIRVGAMVETVAAVDDIAEVSAAADFLSLGTNDLTAQALGLDRTDPRARPELTAHPCVLDMIARVTTHARLSGRPLSVCGDAGAHATTLPLLLGAGIRTISVACALIDETRYRLHRLDAGRCADFFVEALRAHDAAEVAALVREHVRVVIP
jgi:dihydroxyacetone kinase phosphoprotein-dependent L subunit